MKKVRESDKMAAAQACAAMIEFLRTMAPGEVEKMRDRMGKRGQKKEESRHWGTDSWRASHVANTGVVRTRTGYVYR